MGGNILIFQTKKIGDVAKVIPGFAFKSKDWCDVGLPVIKIKNIIGDGSINTNDVDCVPASLLNPKLEKFLICNGDVMVAMTGATAGKVGMLRSTQQFLLNQRIAKLVPVDVHQQFFWCVVSSDEYQERFFKLADGAAQPNMSGSQIEGVEIPFPPLPTQRKIAAILSAYDDLIENNLRRIKILEEMAQNLYREWFVKFRFPGHQHARFIDSALGQISEDWKIVSISDLAIIHRGQSYKGTELVDEGGRPFINLKCIDRDGGFRISGIKKYTGPYKLKFPVFYTAFMKPMTLLLIAISLRAKKMYINISVLCCEKSFCNILKSLHYFRPIFTGKMIILYQ